MISPQYSRSRYFCVVQIGYSIFGVGKSKQSAVADANRWLDQKTSIRELEANDPQVHGNLVLLPCMEAVYKHIKSGGDPSVWIKIEYNGGNNRVVELGLIS